MRLSLESVCRTYSMGETGVSALADVDLRIEPGERVAITGPSGSGKSTLLSLLGCLDLPTSGRYRVGDDDVTAMDDRQVSRLRGRVFGFVFQAFHLIRTLTAVENVEVPLRYQSLSVGERSARAREALARVGLDARAAHRPAQLSGGEQQRVAVARALVSRPSVVLADEPTGNLDSARGAEIADLLLGPALAGTTLVVVTHDPALACRLDRQVVIRDGRIAEA